MTEEVFDRLVHLYAQLTNLIITAEGKDFVAKNVTDSISEIDEHVENHRADYEADAINRLIGLRAGFVHVASQWALGLTFPPPPKSAEQQRPHAES